MASSSDTGRIHPRARRNPLIGGQCVAAHRRYPTGSVRLIFVPSSSPTGASSGGDRMRWREPRRWVHGAPTSDDRAHVAHVCGGRTRPRGDRRTAGHRDGRARRAVPGRVRARCAGHLDDLPAGPVLPALPCRAVAPAGASDRRPASGASPPQARCAHPAAAPWSLVSGRVEPRPPLGTTGPALRSSPPPTRVTETERAGGAAIALAAPVVTNNPPGPRFPLRHPAR